MEGLYVMHNPDLGQVFTSTIIADYMVSLFSIKKDACILDPCFGGGAFLRALYKEAYINVTGIEIDKQWYQKAQEDGYKDYKLLLDDFLKFDFSSKYDGIIMNPPYIRHEKIDDLKSSGITKEFLFSNPVFAELPRTANLYMFFIIKGIELLKDNGEMVVIFPSSWMAARGGKRFKQIINRSVDITDQIDVYGDVFEGNALVEVSILKMIKSTSRHETNFLKYKVENGKLVNDMRDSSVETINMPVLFKEYCSVRRGLTTGCNSVFINPPLNTVDTKHVIPILSSPKDVAGFNVQNAKFDNLLYVSEGELPEDEILNYLCICEEKIKNEGVPKTLYQEILNNKCWYSLNLFSCKGILFSYFIRSEIRFIFNDKDCMVRDNFYIIFPHEEMDIYLMMSLLNNYYTFLQLEKAGKKYGAGLLKIQKYDIEDLKFVDIKKMKSEDRQLLSKYGKQLVETNDSGLIEVITKELSRIMNCSFEQIKLLYEFERNNRLEQV